MKLNFRVIGKLALLLVIIGFFMPIACDQNGFQLASMLRDDDSTLDAILMYLLFFSAVAGCVIGALLLMKKSVKPVFDWVSLLVCIGSGLFVYFNSLRSNEIDLQEGAYVILAGWIASLAAQIVSKMKKET
jgi:uncharacterized membrane protein